MAPPLFVTAFVLSFVSFLHSTVARKDSAADRAEILRALDLQSNGYLQAPKDELAKREVCVEDGYLSALSAVAEDSFPFCSSFISVGYATAPVTATSTSTITVTAGSLTQIPYFVTVPSSTQVVTSTTILALNNLAARNAAPDPTPAAQLPDPAWVKILKRQAVCNDTSIITALSSGCSCLHVPQSTTTSTATSTSTRTIPAVDYSGYSSPVPTTFGVTTVTTVATLYISTPALSTSLGTSVPPGLSVSPVVPTSSAVGPFVNSTSISDTSLSPSPVTSPSQPGFPGAGTAGTVAVTLTVANGTTVTIPPSATTLPGTTIINPGTEFPFNGTTVVVPGNTNTVPGNTISFPGTTVIVNATASGATNTAIPLTITGSTIAPPSTSSSPLAMSYQNSSSVPASPVTLTITAPPPVLSTGVSPPVTEVSEKTVSSPLLPSLNVSRSVGPPPLSSGVAPPVNTSTAPVESTTSIPFANSTTPIVSSSTGPPLSTDVSPSVSPSTSAPGSGSITPSASFNITVSPSVPLSTGLPPVTIAPSFSGNGTTPASSTGTGTFSAPANITIPTTFSSITGTPPSFNSSSEPATLGTGTGTIPLSFNASITPAPSGTGTPPPWFTAPPSFNISASRSLNGPPGVSLTNNDRGQGWITTTGTDGLPTSYPYYLETLTSTFTNTDYSTTTQTIPYYMTVITEIVGTSVATGISYETSTYTLGTVFPEGTNSGFAYSITPPATPPSVGTLTAAVPLSTSTVTPTPAAPVLPPRLQRRVPHVRQNRPLADDKE